MQFLLMCCFDESRWNAIPEDQRSQTMQAYGAWIDRMTAQGHYLGGGKLQETTSAASVTVRSGKPTVIDGPFAETKEQLGGYHLLECRDRDEALALAAAIPTLPVGGKVEVRPLQHLIPGARTR
jgi:hypothetical protein